MTQKQIVDMTPTQASELGFFIGGIVESVAWHTGKELTGINIKKRDGRFLMVITVRDSGRDLVTFIDSPTPLECYRTFYSSLTSKKLKWRESKY